MKKFRKHISSLLVVAMLCSLLPSYVAASSKEHAKEQKKVTEVKTENLKEIVEERTTDSKTFDNGNGKFIKEVYPEKIHNKVGKNYKEISEELVKKNKTGYIETEATNLKAEFPEKMGKNTPIVYSSGEHQLSFKLSFATDGQKKSNPSVTSDTEKSDNAVTYKSTYKDIDLRHIALNNEVKEDWIMNKYNGINEFHYDIQTDLFGQIEKDGSIGFYETESKEEKVFVLPKPVMVDSNYNETLGDGVRSSEIKYELNKKSDGTYDLALKANKEWLSSSKRVFPIYIDPSVSIDALGDTFVMSAYPKNNYNKEWDPSQGEYVLKTGYYDSTTGTNYSFVKFTGIADLKGATIDSAELSAFVTHSYYADTKTGIWVDEVKGQWYADELTWNNKPSSTNITSTTVARDEWANFNVQDTIQAWASGERSNYGFKFHTNGNGKTYWKKITAAESAKKAKLVIAYHYEQMATPTMTATADGTDLNTGSVNVKWKAVAGATGYDLQMWDGVSYQSIYQGTSTSWSSKGMKVFPKAPYKTTSVYSTTKAGVELPLDPSAFYTAKAGKSVTLKGYYFQVVPKYPTGAGPVSPKVSKIIPVPAGEPELPTVTASSYPETDPVNSGRGWLNIKWKSVSGATGYKVSIWNGKTYENYTVGKDTLSISTKGKKIWPTDAEIKTGTTNLHQVDFDKATSIGTGTELPIDPSTTYGNSTRRYSVRIIAMSAAGDSPASDVNYGYMPTYAPKNVTIKSNEDNLVQNKTSLSLSWEPTVGARFYDIILSDGKTEETITVMNKTSYTSLPKYDLEKTYTATVQAYVFDDNSEPESEEDKLNGKRGDSPLSSKTAVKPDMHEDLLGLEDYFTYDDQSFGNASASVNVTTGNMVLQFIDESLYTLSDLGYSFIRTYNSRSTKSSVLGKGWTFVGNETLTEGTNGDVQYADENGTVHLFKKSGDTFTSPKGLYEQLKKEDNTYTITDKNGFIQTYQVSLTAGVYEIHSYTDAYQNEIVFKRNDKGQVIEVSESKGTIEKEKIIISYADDHISKVQYGGHWTKYSYTNDQLTQTTIGSEQSDSTIVENFTYDTNGQLIKYIDGQKNETTFKYTENELVIFDKQAADAELSVTNTYKFNTKENEYKSIDSSDSETIYKRDEKNNTYAVVEEDLPGDDGQNTKAFYTYDAQYNLLESVNPDGTTETNTYDVQGNIITSTSNEGTIKNTYNDQNQLTSTTDVNDENTVNTYEGPSLIHSKVKDEETAYAYDTYGRVTKTTYANGTFEQFDYNDIDRQITSTDKKGNTTLVSYSIYGQKVKETDADGHTKSYTYDSMYPSTLLSVTDGNGNKTAYKYDKNNNLTTLTDALNREKTYTYNDNDQVTAVTMPNMTFTYAYDENGELSQSTLPSGVQTNYTYNRDGQLAQVDNDNETIVYAYDENGNTTSVVRDSKTFKTYGYTTESNLVANYKLGLFAQNYGYDDKERINQVTTSYDNDFKVKEDTTYKENSDDLDHLQLSVDDKVLHDYKSDINVTNNITTLTLNTDLWKQVSQMNDANLLGSITYTTKAQQPFEIKYDYTKNGDISKSTIDGKVSSFVYDGNDQLTKETLPDGSMNTYEYDAVGNRTATDVNGEKVTFAYNEANQIARKNDTAYDYDQNGNLTKDENYQYTYNQQQRLTKVATLDGKTVASYTYDENGLRLTKTVGDIAHEYFYNGEVLDMEVVKVNDVITAYRSYEWNGYTPLGMIVKAKNDAGTFETKAYQFITNHRGDVLSIRDNEDKEVGSYTYDAYGNVLTTEGTLAKENPIRYAGYYYDEETKNYYLQARYYNPENGAFLALDPHPGDDDEPLSQNGYTYANNNPVMNVDPNGKVAWMVVGAITGGLIAWLIYKLEIKLKIRKYTRSSLIAKVGTGAGLGAINGGITGLWKAGGLLKSAIKYGYLTSKEAKRYKRFIQAKHFVLSVLVNKSTKKPGRETWKSFVIKKLEKAGIYI